MTEPVTNSGVQPQSKERVRDEGEQPQSPISIEVVSKVLAVTLVFLYMSGFLISSLHNFQYGFSEMNPLRPRILAAGGWFAIFIAVPFALVWGLKKQYVLKVKSNGLSEFGIFLGLYMASTLFLGILTGSLFAFDNISKPPLPWWDTGLVVVIILTAVAIFGFIVAQQIKGKLPTWVAPALILPYYGYILWSASYELFSKHLFGYNATSFWFLVAGGYIYYELDARKWVLKTGRWDRTIVGFFLIMTTFATVYYPHIMTKWGGGALIPIELTFSKDAPVRSGVQIDCSLIDETDAGFYVIGKEGSSATFIPRSEISSIYYGQGNGHSVFTESLPQQTLSSPPNSRLSNQPTTMQASPSQQPSPQHTDDKLPRR